MDWGLFHAVNELDRHRDGVQDTALAYNATAIFVIVALAGCLWFFARPGGALKPKLAAASAAFSVVVGLLLNVVAGSLWHHDRPFVDHPRGTILLVHHVADNSFPSDHATVAFAAAFAVLVFYRRLGALLVVGAIGVAVARVLVGVHYPVDVAASALIGAASAAIVAIAARPHVTWVVRQLSRLSDPVVAAARNAASLTRR
jgi:undecaprenyl-diphosphatase